MVFATDLVAADDGLRTTLLALIMTATLLENSLSMF